MTSKSLIISGPSENYNIPKDVSLGKYMIDNLKKRKRDEIINIDGFTNETLKCGELIDQSLKLVTYLRSLGLKKGDVVAIIGDNSIKYCVLLVANLYAGLVSHVLNPAYTEGELKHALLISKPKLIFCQETILPSIESLKNHLECVETTVLVEKPVGTLTNNVKVLEDILKNVAPSTETYENLDGTQDGAFIFMSSGTTGLPKGVLLTHANFRTAIGVITDPRYGALEVGNEMVLTAIPMFHVLGLTIQLLAIFSSSKLIVMKRFQPDVYLRCIEQHCVTCLPVVPPILVFLSKSPMVEDYDFTAVQKVLCGAASLGKEVEERISQIIENATLQQVYGFTEGTSVCTFAPSDRTKPGSAGMLIPNMQAKVWDPETGETLGPSKTGELCFKGPVIMKGYVGTTSNNDIDKDGFYRTGDLGYYDNDGFFFITGRIKELIKYKGYQVSPVELENLIFTHPAVKDCGVIGIDDENCGQLPLAFVVRQAGATVSEKDIVDFVADRISVQKRLYGGVKFISDIPKGPSGKILRMQLQDIYKSSQS